MANVAGVRYIGGDFSNDVKIYRGVYDFDDDAGATGALTVFIADKACVIKSFHAVVKTACTSGGSATVDFGVKSGDTDALMDAVAVASLTANSLHSDPLVEGTPNTKNVPLYLAADGELEMTIGVAALTAGKIEFVIEVVGA